MQVQVTFTLTPQTGVSIPAHVDVEFAYDRNGNGILDPGSKERISLKREPASNKWAGTVTYTADKFRVFAFEWYHVPLHTKWVGRVNVDQTSVFNNADAPRAISLRSDSAVVAVP